jgi:L-ascorbate metabolism protein UlaG (beta-lactamase superfamily)
MQYKFLNITKYPQSAFRIEVNGKAIYIDPFRIPEGDLKADYIFITHEHYDHCNIEDVAKIIKEDTIIFGNKLVEEALAKNGSDKPWRIFSINTSFSHTLNIENTELRISCVPAYNLNKLHDSGRQYHPKENGGVGFVLELEKENEKCRILHMGDTDFLEEHKSVKDIDILMIPISGTYVMTKEEAVEACKILKPQIAIPMHFDAGIVGTLEDSDYLVNNGECRVEVMKVK